MIRGGSYYVEPGSPINPAGDLLPDISNTIKSGLDKGMYGTGRTSTLVPNDYLPVLDNGRSVDAGYVPAVQGESSDSPWGQYDRYMQLIKEISDSNTAKSIEMADAQNAWQRETNQIAMDFSAIEAQKQRDWQEYLSSTAHTREVQDLIKAGLNPVLSAGGNGAPMGTGAAAQGVTSAGARGSVDSAYASAALNFLNNTMDYITRLASSMNSGAKADAYLEGRKYAADMQYKIAQDFPNNGWRFFDSYANAIAQAAGYDSMPDMIGAIAGAAFNNDKNQNRGSNRPFTAYTRPPQYPTL